MVNRSDGGTDRATPRFSHLSVSSPLQTLASIPLCSLWPRELPQKKGGAEKAAQAARLGVSIDLIVPPGSCLQCVRRPSNGTLANRPAQKAVAECPTNGQFSQTALEIGPRMECLAPYEMRRDLPRSERFLPFSCCSDRFGTSLANSP